MADDGRTQPDAGGPEEAGAAFRRVLWRKLAERGLCGADLEQEVERLLGKARAMRPVDGSRMSGGL